VLGPHPLGERADSPASPRGLVGVRAVGIEEPRAGGSGSRGRRALVAPSSFSGRTATRVRWRAPVSRFSARDGFTGRAAHVAARALRQRAIQDRHERKNGQTRLGQISVPRYAKDATGSPITDYRAL
jgi:hypothetical protein